MPSKQLNSLKKKQCNGVCFVAAGYFQGEISRGAAGNVAITMNTFESDAFNNETSFNNLVCKLSVFNLLKS